MPAIKNKPPEYGNIPWLSPDDYNKALFQFRAGVGAVLKPLRTMGQSPFVDQAEHHIAKLAEDFGLRVRGVDHQIDTEETVAHRNGMRDSHDS